MNYEDQNGQAGDVQVELALRRFRESVHSWSEQEYSRVRGVEVTRRSRFWQVMANPAMVWTMASALVMASVGVPVTVHHQRQVAAEKQAAYEKQQKATEAAQKALDAANTMDDEDLLDHVDSDIAQAAPDAMQPLVSMMTDTSSDASGNTLSTER
jgi:cell division protein FtsL